MILCWQVINEILKRTTAEEDKEQASRLAEVALFVPLWLFSTAINIHLAVDDPMSFGVDKKVARNKRVDAWTQSTHRCYLAGEARSILRTGAAAETATGAEDAIRNLSTILAQQAVNTPAVPQQAVRSVFNTLPPQTKQLILFASEVDPDDRVPTRPVKTFVEILALNNVAFVRNHKNHFLQHTKGLDVQIPSGLCVAIRTGSVTLGSTDRPGAFSPFCCGPQAIEATDSGGRDANEHASSLMQTQLKTTDTKTGLSDNDIKSISKYSFTIPHNFFELARLVLSMTGVVELLFGFDARLAAMLDTWAPVPDASSGHNDPVLGALRPS